MEKQTIKAFTLLELMVAIIIIGIILAVSGPIYTSYSAKSKFSAIFATMNQYRDDLQVAYLENDLFPSTFSNVTVSSYTTLTSTYLQQVYYGVSSNSQAAYLQFFTFDLGVPDYIESTEGASDGTACRVTLAVVTNATGASQYYCGQWDGTDVDVPLTYLPSSCKDTNISALIT